MTPLNLITEDSTEVFGPIEGDQLSPTEVTSVTQLDAIELHRTSISAPASWPELSDAAFHGPLGEAVRHLASRSEADPAAILVTGLAQAGVLMGKNPHLRISGQRYGANLFMLLVGPTALGRKGTSMHESKQLHGPLGGPEELRGLVSGEAVVARLSDETRNRNLLLVEEEMARLLEAAGRQGSTLSAMIRLLFDGGTLTRSCVGGEMEAKDYFCGLVGHITPDELRLRLSASDQTNGLANRFLFIASHARQSVIWFQDEEGTVELPTKTPGVTVGDLARQGASTGFLKLGADAREWLKRAHASGCYSSNNPLLGRLWTHLCRMAVVYAVLDGSPSVEVCHLEAAAAVVDYAEATTAMVFPSRPVATLADRIRQAVVRAGEDGLTLTELSKLLPRGLASADRDAAVAELKTEGSIVEIRVPGPGRTPTKFAAVTYLEASTDTEDDLTG